MDCDVTVTKYFTRSDYKVFAVTSHLCFVHRLSFKYGANNEDNQCLIMAVRIENKWGAKRLISEFLNKRFVYA